MLRIDIYIVIINNEMDNLSKIFCECVTSVMCEITQILGGLGTGMQSCLHNLGTHRDVYVLEELKVN